MRAEEGEVSGKGRGCGRKEQGKGDEGDKRRMKGGRALLV